MRHAIDHRKLRRNPAHRKALLRNLMNALVRSERIVTTVAKAKELRRLADRLITLGKRNNTHARRLAYSMLSDKENSEKLFSGLSARFAERMGGYTRIIRTGNRSGDGSEMAVIEYLPAEEKKAQAAKTKGRRRKAGEERGKAPAPKGAKPSRKAASEGAGERKPARRKAAPKAKDDSSLETKKTRGEAKKEAPRQGGRKKKGE